jgi:hypothetical protein
VAVAKTLKRKSLKKWEMAAQLGRLKNKAALKATAFGSKDRGFESPL